MSDGLQSEFWYRVAKLRPHLRASTQIGRHRYRGVTWYVLRDTATGENVRVNRITHRLLRHLDGRVTLDQAYRALLVELGEDAPGQDEIILGIAQLAEANMLQADRVADLAQLRLASKRRGRRELSNRVNPLSFQVALFDPSPIVERLAPIFQRAFSRAGAVTLAMLVSLAAMIALVNGSEIAAHLNRLTGSGAFVFLMWAVYPLAKGVHEFAHALAVRRFGGEVTEMGLRLLVMMPLPYVDASGASLFPEKRERAIVAGAGIAAELAIAAIATLFWLVLEPGLLRDTALAAMVVTSVSTVLFNGNPLLKFDGYFVLTDLLELPNLAPRARRHWVSMLQRGLLRLKPTHAEDLARGERPWLVGYGLASWTYRLFLFVSIAVLLATYSAAVGLLVVVYGGWLLLVKPVVAGVDFVLNHPALNGRRLPTLAVGSALIALLALTLTLPMPASTSALGVVWLPERAHVRAGASGQLVRYLAEPGTVVHAGQPLLELVNDELELAVADQEAQLQALQTEFLDKLRRGSNEATLAEDAIKAKQDELDRARERLSSLVVSASTDGRFVVPRAIDKRGRWFEQGEPIAYLLDAPRTTVRLALPNALASRVRDHTESVEVHMLESPDRTLQARMRPETQSGGSKLPSAALSRSAGGWIETAADDPDQTTTLEPIYVFDVAVDGLPVTRAGQRAVVRFRHPDSPLLSQAHDLLRRMLLRHFVS
ncbi:MAG: hypothetical protein R3E87_04190 [Burkholderiaceae bacterium]